MGGQKVNPCPDCAFTPRRRPRRGRYAEQPAVPSPVEIVHLLAQRPELRAFFPLAVAVDAAVRENA